MTAATIPFVRSGFDAVLDFSMPPQFLEVARKILKEVPLEYVILRPSKAVCAARAGRECRIDAGAVRPASSPNFVAILDHEPGAPRGSPRNDATAVQFNPKLVCRRRFH